MTRRPRRRARIAAGILAGDPEGQARIAVFRQALHALGWSEGRNVEFMYRWSGGDVAHARQFAKELLDLRSDVETAKALGLDVPSTLLSRANEVNRMKAPGKLAQARSAWSNAQHDQLNKSDTD